MGAQLHNLQRTVRTMIDTMLIFAYVVSFACGLFVGAVAMYTWGNDNEDE